MPSLITVAALALVAGDAAAQARAIAGLHRFELTGPEGARALLSTIASSAITVAALVFSITMVVLNMASAQFGPRLLANFLRHNATQVVLGTFVGAFAYCLVALAAVRSDDDAVFVPQTAVAGGLALGVAAFALLIYFINHVSRFVQTAYVIDDVARGLESALRETLPQRAEGDVARTPDDEDAEAGCSLDTNKDERRPIPAPRSGYVQAIDAARLIALACEHELVIGLECRPGHFVIEGRPLAWAAPGEQVNDGTADRIRRAVLTGAERTSMQDPEFAVHQLVEIALRALSPGVNDPYTAVNCIDRLAAALCVLADRRAAVPLPARS